MTPKIAPITGEAFTDANGEVIVFADREGGPEWHVEWFDSDGGCYVTVFDGPLAEQRARAYFGALKSGALDPSRVV